jgi:hypothetical protein
LSCNIKVSTLKVLRVSLVNHLVAFRIRISVDESLSLGVSVVALSSHFTGESNRKHKSKDNEAREHDDQEDVRLSRLGVDCFVA